MCLINRFTGLSWPGHQRCEKLQNVQAVMERGKKRTLEKAQKEKGKKVCVLSFSLFLSFLDF